MNLPFLFPKILQKMSCRVRERRDHTKQSVFHHGLIKRIIVTVLQEMGEDLGEFHFLVRFQNLSRGIVSEKTSR